MSTANTNELFLKAYQPIHHSFAKYCSNKAFGIIATEDLMQETILITLSAFDKIKQVDNLLGYMIGVVNNLVKNIKRRKKFTGQWEETQTEFLAANISDPALLVDIKYLHRCIQGLPTQQQEALILFEISGCAIKEIAAIQSSTESAVKTRIHRARKKLKTVFEDKSSTATFQNTLATYFSIFL